MPQKNLSISFLRNFESMSTFVYKSRFIIAIGIALALLLSGCKKDTAATDTTNSALQYYFSQNILNRNFIVERAIDTANDITANYSGYTFVLSNDTSYLHGPMTGTKTGMTTISGTWSCNDDYSRLQITLNSPFVPQEFVFLNRAWKFTKKAIPIMELAPWGTTDPKVLHMQRL